MKTPAHLLPLALFAALPALLSAQRATVPQLERVPVHVGTDGTHWAAGQDYKVALDARGATFYPVLGEAAERNLPLGWCTRSIGYENGPQLVAEPAPAQALRTDEFCCELERGTVVERYLIRADGLEQQFLIREAPSPLDSAGDLVVRGALGGPLRSPDRPARHAEILFFEPGREDPVVRYGAAIAIDAVGRRCDLTTAVLDGDVEIRVPHAFLLKARWPLLIDPLTSRASLNAGATSASLPSIARDDVNNQVLVSYARANAAGDWDFFVRVLDDRFGSSNLIYSDLTTDSVRASSAGWAPPADRWIVAMEVRDATSWRLRVLFQDTTDLAFGTGLVVPVPHSAGRHLSAPQLATSASSPTCFLVAQTDYDLAGPTDTDRTQISGFGINAVSRSVGNPVSLSFVSGETFDSERPQITAFSDLAGYVVTWQEWDPLGTTAWDVIGRRITASGVAAGDRALLLGGDDHELTPVVAGGNGRYLLAAIRRPLGDGSKTGSSLGDRILTRRFAWPAAAAAPTLGSEVQIDSSAPSSSVQLGIGSRPIAYDTGTLSHWSVAWQRTDLDSLRIERIGYDGYVDEYAELEPPAPLGASFYSPSLCHDADANGVVAVYASSGFAFGQPMYGRRFTLPTTAVASNYGSGCAGLPRTSNGLTVGRPWRGSEFFRVELDGGRPNAAVWLLLAPFPGAWPMPLGAPGCQVLLDSATMQSVFGNGVTDALGAWSVPLSLPSTLGSISVYWQFVQFDGGVLYGSAGLRTDVR